MGAARSGLPIVEGLERELRRLCGDLGAHGGSVGETARQIEVLFGRVIDQVVADRARLQASEERYRQVAETAEEGVWLIDAEARTSYVNPKMAAILGYAVDEILGRPVFAFMDAKEQRATEEFLVRRRQGVRERHDSTLRRRDGTAVVTSMATNPLFDASGRYAGALALVTDVTEEQRSQDRLSASEERLALALTASRQGLWDWNLVTDASYLSPLYWELTGYSEGEARTDLAFFLSNVHPDDRSTVERSLEEHLAGRSAMSVIEYRMRRKTGEYAWTRGVGRVTARDDEGAPLRMVGVLQDIADQKRVEEEQRFLAEAGNLLSSSLDYEQTMVAIAAMVVGGFADWCGVDLVEREGLMRLKVACADPSQEELRAHLERLPLHREQHHLVRAVIEARRPLLLERVTPRDIVAYAQGQEHLEALLAVGATSLMAVPMMRQDKALGALVCVSSHSSRRYGASDLRFAEALAERAALAIENARLYRAAVDAAGLRDLVLSVVAHDLRNPLATILMQSAALPRHRPREVIHRAATRMNRLIQNLLEVGLIEMGQLEVDPAPLSVEQLLAETLELHAPLAAASSLELRIDAGSDLPDVWGDLDRLLEVFDNLVGNAIKFTPPGGRITVGAATNPQEVVFRVADSGRGIGPDALPHIFDRFWQATRADRQGAGLGLYIVKTIVEAHGGRIWVESAQGQGSTFFFSVPAAPPQRDGPSPVMH